MKRNFFKKLAFVMALALVVTGLAPAAAVEAAANPKLNATSKTLNVGKKFNFNVQNAKGGKQAWSTSAKKIATVNKSNGIVTAVAPGEATITCKVTLTTKKVVTLTAKVVVKLPATGVAITNLPEDGKIVVNEPHNFNRSLTPKKSTDKTYWEIVGENTAEATVVSNGTVTATKVGTFTLKAVTARNKTQYANGNIKAVEEYTCEVIEAPIVLEEVVQVTDKQIKLTFNTSVKDVFKLADFSITHATYASKHDVKDFSVSDDGTVVTLNTFLSLINDTEYKVEVGESSLNFTASVGSVARVSIETTQIPFNTASSIVYKFYDANGIELTGSLIDSTRVVADFEITNGYLDSDNKLTLFAKGDTAKLTVTYHTYVYENNAEITYSDVKTIVAVDPAVITYGNYEKYAVNKDRNADGGNTRIAIEDEGYYITVFAKDSAGNKIEGITYESSNTDALIVDPDGKLFPLKTGNVLVIASVPNSSTKWTLLVNIVPERKAESITAAQSLVKISNTDKIPGYNVEVGVVVKDQYQVEMDAKMIDVEAVPQVVAGGPSVVGGVGKVIISAESAIAGTYTYKLTSEGKSTIISVQVQNVLNLNNVDEACKLELSATTIDNAFNDDSNIDDKAVTFKVATYKNGVLYQYLNLDKVEVNDTDVVTSGSAAKFATVTTSGSAVSKEPNGTYRVVAKVTNPNSAGGVLTFTSYFVVKDTQAAPSVVVTNNTARPGTDTKVMAKDCFSIKVGDTELNTNITAVDTVEGSNSVYFKTVTVTQSFKNGAIVITHVVPVGKSISIR